jgi:FkbM family methyltransferase
MSVQKLRQIKSSIMNCLPVGLAGRLRAWNLRRIVANYPQRIVEHRYGSGVLKVALNDPMAAGWYDCDWEELPEIALLRNHSLKPGRLVFDLGAHYGVVAMMLAREVTASGKVVALEASPHNASAIRKNQELNHMDQIQVVQAAVSNQAGKLVFNEGLNGQIDDGSGAWGRFEVDAITIDALAEQHGNPGVVFLDVEGAECLALAGASKTLGTAVDWFVEVHTQHGLEKLGGSVSEVLAYFPDHRYERYVRAEEDSQFRLYQPNDPCLTDRFFLVAICRNL